MTPQELLLEVFCLVDDELQALHLGRLRQRGPQPKLADSEVITIELVGAFWKLGTDRDLFRHFRRYHTAEFPALASVDRTTFTRQAANLWHVKQLIQQRRAQRLAGEALAEGGAGELAGVDRQAVHQPQRVAADQTLGEALLD